MFPSITSSLTTLSESLDLEITLKNNMLSHDLCSPNGSIHENHIYSRSYGSVSENTYSSKISSR